MKRDTFLNIATGLMVVCALIVTGLLIRREVFAPSRGSAAAGSRGFVVTTEDGWREYASSGHRMGPATAAVTIVEFSDFECPACRMFARHIKAIREEQPGEVAVVYRHFPIPGHRFAIPAARASECAAAQGRFEPMHDVLFAFADSLGLAPWSWFAARAGVPDTVRFAKCVRSAEPLPSLAADTTAGLKLKLRATPTVLVNRLRFQGTPPLDSVRAIVERAKRHTLVVR